jgi:hypothetical protein
MNKKIAKKKDKKLYYENKESLIKKGLEIDNIIFYTYDYDFKNIINVPIKDFKKEDLTKYKESDSEYYNFQSTKTIHENIKYTDFLYGDWWRIYDKKKDKLYYLTVSTPYLRQTSSKEGLELEIIGLINSHYHKLYGYGKDFYVSPKFIRIKTGKYKNYYEYKDKDVIKDTRELINNWVVNNKNSDIYNYYKNLIIINNTKNLNLKNLIITKEKYDINSLSVIVPFNCEFTYLELFKQILSLKNISEKKSNYNEDSIEDSLDNNLKDFLYQFKPIIKKKIFDTKKRKRKGKK